MFSVARAHGLGLLLLLSASCSAADRPVAPLPPTGKVRSVWLEKDPVGRFVTTYDVGSPKEAEDYYRQIGVELGLNLTIGTSVLSELLVFGGYDGIAVEELETADSRVLMNKLPGDALVTRFFAPKITDVSGRIPPDELGWRKLVRLRARPGSAAVAKGISHLYMLCNFAQPLRDVQHNPFLNRSKTNQVMLVTSEPTPTRAAAYWLIYSGTSAGGVLIGHLDATFDGGADQVSGPLRPYYVPQACRQCHGQSEMRGKLNYLDSDHWQDRTAAGDDFAVVRSMSANGVVFDGGRVTTSDEFRDAFEVVRALNEEILAQNVLAGVDGGADPYQMRAVANWLDRHRGSAGFLAPIDRPIVLGGYGWTKGNAADEELLPLLNRYCFRCHSTVKYHVFDKSAVLTRREDMAQLVEEHEMPRDRRLAAPARRPPRPSRSDPGATP